MEQTDNKFTWVDYLVFALFLVISAFVGILFGFLDRKKMSSKNFLFGGGNLPWFVVALSLQASFLSAIFILSVPVEIYNWGTMYYFLGITYFIAMPFCAHFYLAIYYRLNITSAYEYLEMRYNKLVRTLCSVTFCLQNLLYMSVVLYTPALALAQVTGLPVLPSVIICGLVCTFYTFMGGMKATVWNDFIQMIVIALSLLLVIIFGVIKAGGMSKVWEVNKSGGRIIFDDFRLDPTIRTTFWTQAIGGNFIIFSQYASSQTTIQKFISVKTLKDAQRAMYMTGFAILFFLTMVSILGLVIYAFYEGCDPLMSGKISKQDQIVPLYVMDVLGHLNGLPGLFIAAIFSAALSSVSGSLTALSAVTMTDILVPILKFRAKRKIGERTKTILSRTLILFYGILVTILGFTAQFFGDVVSQMVLSIFGFVGGPLTGIITLGMFFPFSNTWGAVSGLISSLIIASWIAVGAIISQISTPLLPLSTEQCYANNFTSTTPISATTMTSLLRTEPLGIYKVSYMYYGPISLIVCLLVGIIISFITGRTKELDKRLCIDWYSFFPSNVASCLKCEVALTESQEIVKEISMIQKTFEKLKNKNVISLNANGKKARSKDISPSAEVVSQLYRSNKTSKIRPSSTTTTFISVKL